MTDEQEATVPGELSSWSELSDLDASGLGHWRLQIDSGRLSWSPEMYVMFGVDPAGFEPSMRTVGEMLEPPANQVVRERLAGARPQAAPWPDRLAIVRPDGDRRVLESISWAEGSPGRPPERLVGLCRDVTLADDLRRDRERVDRQRATILRAVGEGICGLDFEGRIIFTNPALLTLMRLEEEAIEGRSLHELVHRDGEGREAHPVAECPYHVSADAPASATDTSFRRGDGTRIEVAYMRVGVDDESVKGSVVSFRDITARRAAARLLQTSLQQVQSLSAQRGVLLTHLTEAEERERLRIAADIHDDTIQTLAAVALRLSNSGERARNDADRDLLADAEIAVRGVAERLRGLMFELMPPEAGRDLRGAVATYCGVLFGDTDIAWEIGGDATGLDSERSLVAYRLLQEALRNVHEHSRATRVQISFDRTATELVLRVADDGVGLGDDPVPPTHSGLRIIRQRAQAAGGGAHFGAGPDDVGSTIELRLPLEHRAGA